MVKVVPDVGEKTILPPELHVILNGFAGSDAANVRIKYVHWRPDLALFSTYSSNDSSSDDKETLIADMNDKAAHLVTSASPTQVRYLHS